jgi:hypothetical protein
MTTVTEDLTEKARLRNFGDGFVVIADDVVKFYVETGRFKKHRQIIREIPFADIENVEQQGNDLSIFWKDTKDVFAIAKSSQVEPVLQRIMAALKEHTKEAETKTVTDQQWKETSKMIVNALDTSDSLFSILRKLNGQLDWNLIETTFQQVQENLKNLASQPNSMCIDITQLSASVQERRPKEISEKTFDVVKALYEHFDKLASPGENAEQFHPNNQDSRMVMQATYISNDMLLGAAVGDYALEKEGTELLKVLDGLSKMPGSKIDTNAIKTELDMLCLAKENQVAVVEGINSVVGQKLRELVAGEQQTLLEQPTALKPE